MGDTLQTIPQDAPVDKTLPFLGNYHFSDDGKQFYFRQGLYLPDSDKVADPTWYLARLGENILVEARPPEENILPFLLQNSRLFLAVGSGADLTTGSPADMVVRSHALSPDGNLMAFTAYRTGEDVGLYILDKQGELTWLGDEVDIYDLTWSPDGEYLAFVAPRDTVDQVFRIDKAGVNLIQLTSDPVNKSSPIWGGDAYTLAFLAEQAPEVIPPVEAAPQQTPAVEPTADPAAPALAIYLWQSEANEPRLLVGGLPENTHLHRADNQAGIVYSAALAVWPKYQALYLLDPNTGEQSQVYPPLTIDSVACPEQSDSRTDIPVQITFSNNTQTPSSLPVVLRSSADPLSILVEDRTRDARRIESIDLQGKETRQIEWSVPPSRGLITNISVMVNLGDPFPMAEQHCQVANTYMGMPNLDFLGWILPLAIPGLLLVLPWVLQQKKKWLWSLYALFPVVVAVMVLVEIGFVQ